MAKYQSGKKKLHPKLRPLQYDSLFPISRPLCFCHSLDLFIISVFLYHMYSAYISCCERTAHIGDVYTHLISIILW